MKLSNLCAGLAVFALLVPLSGCFVSGGGSVSSEPAPAPAEGTLTLAFSVEGSTHPSSCTDAGATAIELVVYDVAGREFTTEYGDCTDFDISVTLPNGTYSADATLLDARGYPASTTLPLDDLHIIGGTDLQVTADFPPSSLLE